MINITTKKRIAGLMAQYEALKVGRESLLQMLTETEIPEQVYNSNAIENSTLTLSDTEDIIFENKTPKDASLREVYEAKNLALVLEHISHQDIFTISEDNILAIHKILLSGINNYIAGRYREYHERVRVGRHIAPAPEKLPRLMDDLIYNYNSDAESYFLDKIAKFHARFEHVHPFNDGNGRTGRILINAQLAELGYPPIMIYAKNKYKGYYPLFEEYLKDRSFDGFTELFAILLCESLHKRIAYLQGKEIIKLADYAKQNDIQVNTLHNAARRQTIPAFRERGVWKIASDYREK